MAGWIAAGASILGDVMSQQGQQQTNAQNTANMMQQEQWQEKMSDTAMQRRVSDLKAAGLNPLLAVGTNGAQVGGVGLPSLQNPNASMAGLGAQVSNAQQVASQVDVNNAQASKLRADAKLTQAQTPGQAVMLDKDGNPDFSNADGGTLGNLTAAQQFQNIQNAKATWQNIVADTTQKASQTSLNDALSQVQQLGRGTQQMLQEWVVAKAKADAGISESEETEAGAQAKIMGSKYGVWIKALQSVLGGSPLGSIVGAAANRALR